MIKESEKTKGIISLLPDSVANQIAAGEVIQRPASIVKELLENSIDSGATNIQLIVKDAGKTLVQVIDNGCGMGETDIRLCFERHATSKIKTADDLFSIRSMGFRGEAMASIAAIAQVNCKSKRQDDELGIELVIEGSEVKSQEPCQTAEGTNLSIKNIFYNVPARRKFLKSNPVETRHIIDEFQRVALPNPDIAFSMHHNNNEVFRLQAGSFRQRIVGIFGNKYNQRLVPVEEETSILKVTGFVGKPEAAKKTRGEQFFFVNNRFIKSPYLHHALQTAFEELIPKGYHPTYFLLLETDPEAIDINIHPTKTEIKFEEEKAIYAIIRSAVRQSLGKYNIAPSLDFEKENTFDIPLSQQKTTPKEPSLKVDPNYNPFQPKESKSSSPSNFQKSPKEKSDVANWEKLFKQPTYQPKKEEQAQTSFPNIEQSNTQPTENRIAHQLHSSYILTQIKSGFLIIHQQRAHQRVLFEQFIIALQNQKGASQQQLFPQTVELAASDFALLQEIKEEVAHIGFDIADFGKNTLVVNGLPAQVSTTDAKTLLEGLLETYKNNLGGAEMDKNQHIAWSMVQYAAIKLGTKMQVEEMNNLIDELFACEMPQVSPVGKPVYITLSLEELQNRFK